MLYSFPNTSALFISIDTVLTLSITKLISRAKFRLCIYFYPYISCAPDHLPFHLSTLCLISTNALCITLPHMLCLDIAFSRNKPCIFVANTFIQGKRLWSSLLCAHDRVLCGKKRVLCILRVILNAVRIRCKFANGELMQICTLAMGKNDSNDIHRVTADSMVFFFSSSDMLDLAVL